MFQAKGDVQYVLTTGSSYDGEWNINEMPDGEGVLILKDIGKYEGEFYSGQREGTGTFTWSNGDSYTGDRVGDVITGFGTITYANGNTLNGSFSENKFVSGDFTAKLDIGTIKISIDEYGSEDAVLTLTDGTKYVGALSNGKFNGDCTINYANGDKYEGKVANNLKSGNGTYTWDDNASYVGNWSNDKMNGTGIYDFPNLYELTAFIEECERQNCFVKFENEDIVISNTQESDKHLANHMKMIIAFSIVQDSRYLQNYRRYLKTKGTPLNPESN